MIDLRHIKKQQQTRLAIVIIVVVLVGVAVYYATMQSGQSNHKDRDAFEQIHLVNPADHIDEEASWIEDTQGKLAAADKERDALNKKIEALYRSSESSQVTHKEDQAKINALTDQLRKLQQQQIQSATDKARNAAQESQNNAPLHKGAIQVAGHNGIRTVSGNRGMSHHGATSNGDVNAAFPMQSIKHLHAALEDQADLDPSPLKNPQTYVPAGTFAKAVLLSGADANAAVSSQSNPDPMLFRILDNGVLPNGYHSRLKNCVVVSAVSGDISSERGKIRFERLSCTRQDGNIIDVPVEGYIAGADGKSGIRGNPVWREGAQVERAFMAGILSGLSDSISSAYTTTSVSALGSTETVNDGEIAQYGVASGISKASDRLANYYIQRAEQYHPVIQIGAGAVVDVVFIKGFYFDEDAAKEQQKQSPVRDPASVRREAQKSAREQAQQFLNQIPSGVNHE